MLPTGPEKALQLWEEEEVAGKRGRPFSPPFLHKKKGSTITFLFRSARSRSRWRLQGSASRSVSGTRGARYALPSICSVLAVQIVRPSTPRQPWRRIGAERGPSWPVAH
ncbi:MAG: hypothetical protein ACPIOQ_35155 [Promethearchaeia archaeon]